MCRHFVAAAVVLVVCQAAARGDEKPRVAQRWAVLVGVDDYAYAQKLQYCGADQKALRDQLLAADFPEDHVFLLYDGADDVRNRPSRGNIERQLGLVLQLAEEGDLVIVSFSGHGVHLDGKSFLCPGDCTLDDPASLISVNGIYDRLSECAATFKLVLVDACRNDPRPGGARAMTATAGSRAMAQQLKDMKLPDGVVLLNSCAPGEISWEDEEFGHGVFMHYVLDGLRGGADADGDSHVSLQELQGYAGGRTKSYVANKFRVAQRPFFKGDLTTEALEFALLPVPAGGAPRSAVPPIENSLGMKLVYIPAGQFMMGSPEDEVYRDAEEVHHTVRITRPFYLGATEVTQAQYATVMGVNPSAFSPESTSTLGNRVLGMDTSDFPVEKVSYEDALEFCRRLSLKEGKAYRLPTEAEWEYACRAGTTTPFSFGERFTGREANGNGAEPYGTDESGPFLERTTAVASYPPNTLGLFDMHGNVWEWCSDWYDPGYYAASPKEDPPGPAAGESRVVRGGGYYHGGYLMRSARRNKWHEAVNDTGFRVVRAP